ncbi:ATP-dependent RNA helicase dbp9, partial [Apiospora rasikravindrae]
MKRKLDENDQPAATENAETTTASSTPAADAGMTATWESLRLDSRLLQAIASQNWKKPTLVQSKAIPLALDGRDVLAKAKTGSGKTSVYVLPLLEAILKRKQTTSAPTTTALILVPTRELADQVVRVIDTFAAFCKDIQTVKLSEKLSDAVTRTLLSNLPDLVVGTPARVLQAIKSSALPLDGLKHLVLDESDLLLSYGYDENLKTIASTIPKGVQTILTSATLTSDVEAVKDLFCRDPAILNLEEKNDTEGGVDQFYVKCAEDEKFLCIYVIFKLQLIKGKSIVFVHDVDRSYRLKLYLEQFGIRSTVLNSELPINSRIHIVQQFSQGVYDILIASDEHEVLGGEDEQQDAEEPKDGENADRKDDKSSNPPKKKRKAAQRDKEYGVSRGIDFKGVAAVINFDLPTSSKSYTHRIGRTGRAGQNGISLSFVIPSNEYRKHMPTSIESTEHDEKVLARITKQQAKKGKELKPYNFDKKALDAFRYRMNDALRAVTKVAIREARIRELKQELVKSEKLKRHFEENPAELQHLRHDSELRAARLQPHLKQVPDYLLPPDGKKAVSSLNVGYVPLRKPKDGKDRKGKSKKGKRTFTRKSDPLKSFRGRGKGK